MDELNDVEIKKQLSILAAGIEVEKFGAEFYTRTSPAVRDKNGSLLLKGLGEDEKKHRKYLEMQMLRLAPGLDPQTVEPENKYIGRIPGEMFMPPGGGTFFTPDDEIKALEIGIQVEKNSIEMYSEARDLVREPELKEIFGRLVRWEEGHRDVLEENLHYLRRGGTWYGYTPILDG